MAIKVSGTTVIDDSRNGFFQNVTTTSGGVTVTGAVVAPLIVARGGNAGQEGGQLVLGFANGSANTITGQTGNTWNLDVSSANTARLFAEIGGSSTMIFSASGSTGRMVVGADMTADTRLDVRDGVYASSTEASLQVAVPTGQWKSRFGIKSDGSGVPRMFLEGPADNSGNRVEGLSMIASGQVGIGTTVPSEPLHVNATTNGGIRLQSSNLDSRVLILNTTSGVQRFPQFTVINYAGPTGNTGFGVVELQKARGNIATPVSVSTGDILGGFNTWGHNGTTFASATRIQGEAEATFSTAVTAGLTFITTSGGTQSYKMRLSGAGQLILADGNPVFTSVSGVNSLQSSLQINNGVGIAAAFNRFSADGLEPSVQFLKSRNATYGSHTVVNDSDNVGTIRFAASDGTNFIQAATIQAHVDGTPGTNDMPGRLAFYTTPDGSTTPTERMRITNDGRVAIGTTSPNVGVRLNIGGTYLASGGFSTGIAMTGVVPVATTTSHATFASLVYVQDPGAAGNTIPTVAHYDTSQPNAFANTVVTNQFGFRVASNLTGATNNYGFYGNLAEAAGRWNFFANGTANNQFNGSVVVSTNHAFDAVRITQAGVGNALVVEDQTNPDSTPFVIDTNGRFIIGRTTPTDFALPGYAINYTPSFQINGTHYTNSWIAVSQFSTSNSTSGGAFLSFNKSNNATVGSHTIVENGQNIGGISFAASDGAKFVNAAQIWTEIDGTPGTDDMPGRLLFGTTSDGQFGVAVRMRINNDGRVGIGGTPTTQTLLVSKTLTGGVDQRSIEVNDTVQSGVTSQALSFLSIKGTQAASFTLPILDHFQAYQGTFGAGSFVTNQVGFKASNTLIGANNNFGFVGELAALPGDWNFYASGTANNYFNGNVWIGTASATEKLYVRQTDASNNTATFDNSSSGGGLRGVNVRATNNNTPALQLSRWYSTFSTGDVGQIRFDGLGTTGNYVEHAAIYASTSGTNTTNGAPTVLSFRTYGGTGAPGATERMRIAAGGNVGINQTNPGYLLDVNGTFNTTAPVTLATGTRGDAQVEVGGNRISYTTGGTWAASGSATVTITYNNHGFSDGQRVELFFANTAGTNATNGAYTVSGSATNTFTITNPASITGSGNVRIDSIGNAYLDLIGDPTYSDYGLRIIRYNTGASSGSEIASRGVGGLFLTTLESSSLIFRTNSTERGRFAPTGEFLLGRTYTANERLGIGGSTTSAAAAGIYNDTTIGTSTTTSYTSFSSYLSTAAGASPYTITNVSGYDSNFFTLGANTTITNLYGFRATGLMNVGVNNYGFHSGITEGANRWNFFAAGSANNYFAGSVTIDVNNAFNGLRITQQGAGNALLVEDSANPDSTPFVVSNDGTVISGSTTSVVGSFAGAARIQQMDNTGSTNYSAGRFTADALGSGIDLFKSRNATTGSHTAVQSGDTVGSIYFSGSDGSLYIRAAQIRSEVDGSVAANGMPGRLTFATTPSSSNTPIERLRIDSAGNVNIGTFTTSISSRLTVVGQANFTDASNNTRLRVAYGTVPGFGGTAAYIVNADNSPLYLGANNTATGGVTVSTNNNVIIGGNTDTGAYKLQVIGAFGATTKSFVIDHPTKPGMKLRYASLEGPENGVYIRGRNRTGIIILPDYWAGLVDADTITVQLTPVGKQQSLYVESVTDDAIYIGKEGTGAVDCFYTVYAERKDVEKLIVEYTES